MSIHKDREERQKLKETRKKEDKDRDKLAD